MSNENPNNHFHWRNKLDDMEHLPGGTLNKEMAWDKLYRRLRGKQGNKKFFWYWVAVACLFFALIITLMNYSASHTQHAAGETAIKQAGQSIKPPSVGQENKKNRNVNPVEPQKNISTVKGISHKKIYHLSSAEMISKVRPNNTISDFLQDTSIGILPKTNIVSTIAPTTSQKKKLNVVHINELNDPAMDVPDLVRAKEKHFKLKFGNEEVFANPSVASKPATITILKTRFSSN